MKIVKYKNENYYGSPLNEFIDIHCSHQMDCINIDCLLLKVSKKAIRFIEFKQTNERRCKSETRVMKILNYLLKQHANDWQTEFYIVRGDPPFESVDIEDIEGNRIKTLTHGELISWLNFEKQLLGVVG